MYWVDLFIIPCFPVRGMQLNIKSVLLNHMHFSESPKPKTICHRVQIYCLTKSSILTYCSWEDHTPRKCGKSYWTQEIECGRKLARAEGREVTNQAEGSSGHTGRCNGPRVLLDSEAQISHTWGM